jgi:hypothetical protein
LGGGGARASAGPPSGWWWRAFDVQAELLHQRPELRPVVALDREQRMGLRFSEPGRDEQRASADLITRLVGAVESLEGLLQQMEVMRLQLIGANDVGVQLSGRF